MPKPVASRTPTANDFVEEYWLLAFPTVAGEGERLFPQGTQPRDRTCASVPTVGPAMPARYRGGGA